MYIYIYINMHKYIYNNFEHCGGRRRHRNAGAYQIRMLSSGLTPPAVRCSHTRQPLTPTWVNPIQGLARG